MRQHLYRLFLCAALFALTLQGCAPGAPAQPVNQPTDTASAAGFELSQEKIIMQVKIGEITIDGDLAEWAQREWVPVCFSSSGERQEPSADLDVRAAFAFDATKLYLAVRAVDDDIEVVDRSFRYGDGFFFTLVAEEGKESSTYVYQFAFDQQTKRLWFKNGEFLPSFNNQDLEFRFRQHSDRVDYEAAIPIRLLQPFNPFIYEKVAVNLIYADRDNGSVAQVMIHPDRFFDTEESATRSGEFFVLRTTAPQSAQEASFHAALKKNYYRDRETVELGYAINAHKSQKRMSIHTLLLRDQEEVQQGEENLGLQAGINRGTLTLVADSVPSGNYTIRASFLDAQGNALAEYADHVFVLNQGELEDARKAISAFQAQTALTASLPNVEIRFDWIDQFYQRTGYGDIADLNVWWNDIVYLSSKLENGEPAVFGNGTIKRYAHRSAIDNTLQPYSVFLPEAFDANTKYPLLVGLHGSGVDEQAEMMGWAELARALGYPVIAPKARGLSDYYTGASGEDVFECIEHFVQLFPNVRRDRIFLGGVSMGGYGTWHLGMLKPEYFRGLIVLSGVIRSDILDGIDRLGRSNILVLHGDADLAVPVDGARAAVEKLRALNANVVYIEVPGGGHGDYVNEDLMAQVAAWVRKYSE